jgi:hypothetical protein
MTPPEYIFFVKEFFLFHSSLMKILFFKDHHVPLDEQQQQQENIELSDEHEPSIETQNERPLTPNNRHHFDTNVWVNKKEKKMFLLNMLIIF